MQTEELQPINFNQLLYKKVNFPLKQPSYQPSKNQGLHFPNPASSFSKQFTDKTAPEGFNRYASEYDNLNKERCYATTTRFDAEIDAESKSDEQTCNEQLRPLSAITKNPIIRETVKKLLQQQELEDIRRFICRLVPSQRKLKHGHPNSETCFAGHCNDGSSSDSEGESKNLETCTNNGPGPFLSCAARHSKSNDYDEFPDFPTDPFLGTHNLQYASGTNNPFNMQRPTSSSSSRPTGRPCTPSSSRGQSKCRACPRTSIFLSDPDLWYSDYKYQITYGRIPTSHKKNLSEKLQLWITSDDYKDKVAWFRNRSHSLYKFQANHRMVNQQRNRNNYLVVGQGSSPRPDAPGPIKYGPSAIAAVSGFNFKKTSNMNPVNEGVLLQSQSIGNNGGGGFSSGSTVHSTNEVTFSLDEIPWPTDNLRYYDDDTDPRITELLAKAPFVLPGVEKSDQVLLSPKPKSPQTQNHDESSSKTSAVAGASSNTPWKSAWSSRSAKTGPGRQSITIDKILKPVEYTIGSGRLMKKKENNLKSSNKVWSTTITIQQPNIKTNSKELKSGPPANAKDVFKYGMGDATTTVPGNKLALETGEKLTEGSNEKIAVKSDEQRRKYMQNTTHKKVVTKTSPTLPIQTVPSSSAKVNSQVKKRQLRPLLLAPPSNKPKNKTIRRFKKSISTVSLGVPKSKDKVSFLDDNDV